MFNANTTPEERAPVRANRRHVARWPRQVTKVLQRTVFAVCFYRQRVKPQVNKLALYIDCLAIQKPPQRMHRSQLLLSVHYW